MVDPTSFRVSRETDGLLSKKGDNDFLYDGHVNDDSNDVGGFSRGSDVWLIRAVMGAIAAKTTRTLSTHISSN